MSPQLTDENRDARRSRIGASEVAAIVEPGSHPYTTPGLIAARILGGIDVRPDSSAMRAGRLQEAGIVADVSERYGVRVRMNRRTYALLGLPLAATPDAYVLDGHGLIEAKATARMFDLRGDCPRDWYWQAIAQLACTGRGYVIVAALSGSRMTDWVIEGDDAVFARLIDAVRAFDRDYLQTRTLPDDAPAELRFAIELPSGARKASEYEAALIAKVTETRERATAYQSEADTLRAALLDSMTRTATAEVWTSDGHRATITTRDDKPASITVR